MNDFMKIKTPFSIALLVAMFAINPIVQKLGNASYRLFGLSISLIFIYLLFCIFLGASVYFYAIGLIGDRPLFALFNKIGHLVYALALMIPPLFIILYPLSIMANFLIGAFKSEIFSKIIEFSGSAIVGLAASFFGNLLFKAFTARDRKDKIEHLFYQEKEFLNRAHELFEQGHYDLAVTESWKAMETSLRKTFETKGIKIQGRNFKTIIDFIQKNEILNSNEIKELINIRQIRNLAVHTERKVSKIEAKNVFDIVDKLMASLYKVEDKCVFCGKSFPLSSLESDNVTGKTVCKECAAKYPDWEDFLLDAREGK